MEEINFMPDDIHKDRSEEVNVSLVLAYLDCPGCRAINCVVVTHAGCIAAGVGIAFSRICLSVCLSVCPRSNRKTA